MQEVLLHPLAQATDVWQSTVSPCAAAKPESLQSGPQQSKQPLTVYRSFRIPCPGTGPEDHINISILTRDHSLQDLIFIDIVLAVIFVIWSDKVTSSE